MAETRLVPVPDGLAGQRLDVALSRMLGFSRTVAADLVDDGHVAVDGRVQKGGVKLRGGEWLEIALPDPQTPATPPEPVDGLAVIYDDDDLVAVDKPIGVAAHPSPGWTGPTVVQ